MPIVPQAFPIVCFIHFTFAARSSLFKLSSCSCLSNFQNFISRWQFVRIPHVTCGSIENIRVKDPTLLLFEKFPELFRLFGDWK